MYNKQFQQLNEPLHADEALIQDTLQRAERRLSWRRSQGWRMAAVIVGVLFLVVAVTFFTQPAPRDVIASNGELPETTGDLLPLPSDDLTLSVSDVTLVSDTELSLILTVQGDKVDPLTTIDWAYDYTLPSVDGSHLSGLDAYEGQPSNELRFLLTIESRGRHILEVLGPTLNLKINRYTIGNQETETVHEIDWNTVDFTLQEEGEPIIDLGSGLSICGFGFTEEGWLIVQSRWPITSLEPTYIMNWLSSDSADTARSEIYMRLSKQYVEGDYIYSNYTFPVTREELDGIDLGIFTVVAGEQIKGTWPINVDLSHLTAE